MDRIPFPARLALNRPVMAVLRFLALAAWPLHFVQKAWLEWIIADVRPITVAVDEATLRMVRDSLPKLFAKESEIDPSSASPLLGEGKEGLQ